ncbi:MAG TPA: hypothetical protein VGR57_22140, partial [Ktedonobacterales bacterium]|nr:hypothetical protein [Ktedonobacterales bacterium]
MALFGVGSFVARLPGHYADLQRVCTGSLCAYGQLRPEAVRSLQALNLSLGGYAVLRVSLSVAVTLTWFVVAAVLAWRRSDDWLALLVALWFVFDGTGTITGVYGLTSAIQTQAVSVQVINYAARFGGFSLVLALFPTRRIVPRAAFSLLVLFAFFVAGPPLFAGSLTLALRLGTLAGLALAQLDHFHIFHVPVWRVSA